MATKAQLRVHSGIACAGGVIVSPEADLFLRKETAEDDEAYVLMLPKSRGMLTPIVLNWEEDPATRSHIWALLRRNHKPAFFIRTKLKGSDFVQLLEPSRIPKETRDQLKSFIDQHSEQLVINSGEFRPKNSN